MKVSQGIHHWLEYHNLHSKKTPSKPATQSFPNWPPNFGKETWIPWPQRRSSLVFIPQKVADRLKEYIINKGIRPSQRIFPISYTAGRKVVNQAGKWVGIHLRPHDLRRHAATYASRSGVPIEIVSKVILRHANLSTTQRYLGTVSDVEAIRWIDNLYG